MSSQAGIKFVVSYSVEGSGEADVGKIERSLKGLVKATQQASAEAATESVSALSAIGGAAAHAGGALAMIGGGFHKITTAAEAFSSQMDRIGEVGFHSMEFGIKIVESFGKSIETMLHKGSEFEGMLLQIQGAGKSAAEAQKILHESVSLTTELPITESQAVRIATAMTTVNVDPSQQIGKEGYAELAAKGHLANGLQAQDFKGKGPSAISAFGDILAASAQLGGADSNVAIHELSTLIETGVLTSNQRFGNLTEHLKKIGKESTGEKRLEKMVEYLKEKNALGLAKAASLTLGGVLSNYKGMIDMISLKIMEPGEKGGLQQRFVGALKNMYDTISDLFSENKIGEGFMNSIKGGAEVLVSMFEHMQAVVGKVVKTVGTFISQNPFVVKLAVGFGLLSAAILIVGGAVIAATAGVLGLTMAFVTLGTTIGWALLPIILLTGPLLLGVMAGLVAGVAGVYYAFKTNFAGINTFLENGVLLMKALSEAWDDWKDGATSTSRETGEALDKSGMMRWFLQAIHVIREAEVWVREFQQGFMLLWPEITQSLDDAAAAVSEAFQVIKVAVVTLLESFGLLSEQGGADIKAAETSGTNYGFRVAQVFKGVADAVKDASTFISENMGTFVDSLINGYIFVLQLKDGLMDLGGVVVAIGQSFMLLWDIVSGIAGPILMFLAGAAKATSQIAQNDFSGAADTMKTTLSESDSYAKKQLGDVGNRLDKIAQVYLDHQDRATTTGLAIEDAEKFRKSFQSNLASRSNLGPSEGRDMTREEQLKSEGMVSLNAPKGRVGGVQVIQLKVDSKTLAEVVKNYNDDDEEHGGHTGIPGAGGKFSI